jgi:succinate-semialdehyde dehydrogenase/glutarate-semialdehyde dehydrogenase
MYTSINPISGVKIWEKPELNRNEASNLIDNSYKAYLDWQFSDHSTRKSWLQNVSQILKQREAELARWITDEMGKPIAQSEAEVQKCAWLCDFYSENAEDFLSERVHRYSSVSYIVRPEPLGIILGIMPWNYPLWQAFRYAIPAVMAGNSAILRPASNVGKCGELIESVFREAGLPEGVFYTAFIHKDEVEFMLSSDKVRGVALTGSDRAGSIVASMAGRELIPVVMELGGSDVFIVLEDADLETAARTFVQARLNNTGQTCIAAKRLLVQNSVRNKFMEFLLDEWGKVKMGDPNNRDNDISCLCREDIIDDLQAQYEDALTKGAESIFQGGRQGASLFFKPAIIAGVSEDMRAYSEELFGPLAVVYGFDTYEQAVEQSNRSQYGLGAAIYSSSSENQSYFTRRLEAGHVSVNRMVSSDPRVPFGGIKKSGFGRELGKEGIFEFVNLKTIAHNPE